MNGLHAVSASKYNNTQCAVQPVSVLLRVHLICTRLSTQQLIDNTCVKLKLHCTLCVVIFWRTHYVQTSEWYSYTFTTLIAGTHAKNCWLQDWTLYKSADCRWISIAILYVSFRNSATVGRLVQVQSCNRPVDQSTEDITSLKCAKESPIL